MVAIATLFFWFILSTLSTLRATEMLHEEVGPWDIFDKLRTNLGIIEFNALSEDTQCQIIYAMGLTDQDILPLYDPRSSMGKLFNCVRCLSMWPSAIHAILIWLTIGYPIILIPVTTLAISAAVVAIHEKC